MVSNFFNSIGSYGMILKASHIGTVFSVAVVLTVRALLSNIPEKEPCPSLYLKQHNNSRYNKLTNTEG